MSAPTKKKPRETTLTIDVDQDDMDVRSKDWKLSPHIIDDTGECQQSMLDTIIEGLESNISGVEYNEDRYEPSSTVCTKSLHLPRSTDLADQRTEQARTSPNLFQYLLMQELGRQEQAAQSILESTELQTKLEGYAREKRTRLAWVDFMFREYPDETKAMFSRFEKAQQTRITVGDSLLSDMKDFGWG